MGLELGNHLSESENRRIYLSNRPANNILTTMHAPTPQQLKFFDDMDATAALIRLYVPIIDVSLIIEDYLAEPLPGWDAAKDCVACRRHNSRRVSFLCKNCATICLQCKCNTCSSDKKLFCSSCKETKVPSHWPLRKDYMYAHMYRAIYPSDVHRDSVARLKREAADPVLQARKEEENKKIEEFLSRECSKDPAVQIRELRQKLWDANTAINSYKANHYAPELEPRPKFPYY